MSKSKPIPVKHSGQLLTNSKLPGKQRRDLPIHQSAPPILHQTEAAKLVMFDKFRRTIQMTEAEVFTQFTRQATKCGYTITTHKDDWVIASNIIPGIKPVFITAHVDTVRPAHHKPKLKLVLDKQRWCFRSKTQAIIGADDRGGCLIIMELLATMQDKSVIFALFNYEESGGGFDMRGSSLFAECPDEPLLNSAKLFIGLDRRGCDEYVTYDYDNSEIDTYLEHFGYQKEHGSFSDVTHLAYATRTSCINISAGFTAEHTQQETGWLYPVFRAIETIPQLYDVLENAVYPAEGREEDDDYRLYAEDEELLEFIDDLYRFGETSIQGYSLTVKNVYCIVSQYLETYHPGLEGKPRVSKHSNPIPLSDTDADYLSAFTPF